ncbi:MAG: precorrin-6y C5,15-methyltransferase (decarboxylating) subunit CbiE [Actinobacteria bacterium]|nr:precorrin-6y C5,15-methyltransferase (decarboxylating) subunit CbiE [Actinomycetota bacterium]
MKRIAIVGIGTSADTITAEGLKAIQQAEVLIGAGRLLDAFAAQGIAQGKERHSVFMPDDVAHVIEESDASDFVVLVSGDVGFYSGATKLCERLATHEIRLIPGISSVSHFFAKCFLPWQDAALVSCHGTDADIVGAVRRNRYTFVLTGGNIRELAASLCEAGFGHLHAHVGENLGYPEERVTETTVAELKGNTYASLSVLLIENEGFDTRVRTGIPDEEFIRSEVPMTKSEVRAVCLSKLALGEDAICYDVGCGTGSVTVEMALSSHKGHVYAFDRNEAALKLTNENCKAFHIGNVTTVGGLAPDAFTGFPAPDAAFIGGSSRNMDGIVRALLDKNPRVRIVIAAIAIESVSAAIQAMENAGIETEVAQLSVSRAKVIGSLHMMTSLNPIFVVSGDA